MHATVIGVNCFSSNSCVNYPCIPEHIYQSLFEINSFSLNSEMGHGNCLSKSDCGNILEKTILHLEYIMLCRPAANWWSSSQI